MTEPQHNAEWMAIPDARTIYEQAVRAGFFPTEVQVRMMQASLDRYGEKRGEELRAVAVALRKAGNAYGKALLAEVEALRPLNRNRQ